MAEASISTIKRNHAFDAMRFLGVLIIMLAHSTPPKWLFQLRNFGTPLLIIASALTYSYLYQHRNMDLGKFYKKRLTRLTIPAWIFLSFFFVSFALASTLMGKPYPFEVSTILSSYLLWSGIGYVWILKVYIILALITPLALTIERKFESDSKLIFTLTIFYVFYEIAYRYLPLTDYSYIKRIFDEGIFIVIPFSILYIYGIRLRKINQKLIIKNTILSLFAFIAIALLYFYNEGHFVQTQYYKYPPRLYYLSYSLFLIHCIYLAALKYEKILKNEYIQWLSSNSLWIYLWHIFAIYIIRFTHIFEGNTLVNSLIKICIMLGFGIFTTYLQKKMVDTYFSSSNYILIKNISSYLK